MHTAKDWKAAVEEWIWYSGREEPSSPVSCLCMGAIRKYTRVKLHKMGLSKPIVLGGQKEAGLSVPLGLSLLLITLHQFLSFSGPLS